MRRDRGESRLSRKGGAGGERWLSRKRDPYADQTLTPRHFGFADISPVSSVEDILTRKKPPRTKLCVRIQRTFVMPSQ